MSHDHESPADGVSAVTDPPPAPPAEPDFLARARRILGGDIRPDDYLPVASEVSALVAEELAQLREREFIDASDDFRVRLVNQWALQYSYGGQPVACRRTDRGVIVFAAGTADIQRFLNHFPRLDQRPGVVTTTPAPWQPSDPTASPNR